MSDACQSLHDFVAGELDEARADAFRLHLGECDTCPVELGSLLQLAALEDEAADLADSTVAEPSPASAPIDELAARRRRRAVVATGAAVLIAAAAAFLFFVLREKPGSPEAIALASAPTRPIEFRVSGADDYRPYEVMRSGDALPREPIELKTLATLQERGLDLQLANAYLLMREPDKAEAILAKLDQSAAVLAERGVAAALLGDKHRALHWFAESLKKEPANTRVLWNQAIIHRELDLPLSAAALFEKVAELGEPGWAAEATKQAEALRKSSEETTGSYKKALSDGRGATARGETFPLEVVTRYRGLGRLLFYDAVRAAAGPDALESLRPHAEALDSHYKGGHHAAALELAKKSSWKQRSALAASYAKVLSMKDPRATAAQLLATARTSKQDDITFGLLVLSDLQDSNALEEMRVLAEKLGDPWFELIVAARSGNVMFYAGRVYEAETALRSALGRCAAERLPYRCSRLGSTLVAVLGALSKISEAREVAAEALRFAAEAGDVLAVSDIRQNLAQVELQSDETANVGAAISRAYLSEELLASSHPCVSAYVNSLLAQHSIRDGDLEQAIVEDRATEAARVTCGWPLNPGLAMWRANVLGRKSTDADRAAFLAQLKEARATASPVELAGYDLAEGMALLASEPSRAIASLEAAIASVDKLEAMDVEARMVRAWAFTSLTMHASRKGEHALALARLAAEARIEVPGRCVVGLAYENRLAVVVVGADGVAHGRYDPSYKLASEPLERSDLARLESCDEVSVLARSPFYGRPKLLPDEMAWRFVGSGIAGAKTAEGGLPLVVADIEAPATLELPRLATWSGDVANTDATIIRGRDATPERVIAALTKASDIELHAHGLVSTTSGDAFVVLSPGTSGEFRLTAEKISKLTLPHHPVVILGACNAGRSAAYLHEPWGLPISFLRAGARTVFASPNPIPDSSSSAFFAAVRKKLRAGSSASSALRDTRLEWSSQSPTSSRWASEILVFE